MDVLSGDGFMEYVGVSPYRAKWKERMTWKPSIDEWLYAGGSMDIKNQNMPDRYSLVVTAYSDYAFFVICAGGFCLLACVAASVHARRGLLAFAMQAGRADVRRIAV